MVTELLEQHTSIALMVPRDYPLSIQGTGTRAANWISRNSPSKSGEAGARILDKAIESVRHTHDSRGVKAHAI